MNGSSGEVVALSSRRKVALTISRREALEGYIYLTPWVLGLLLFIAGPMVASLILSLTDYDIVSPINFIGLANYRTAFTKDKLFWLSLRRTFSYALVVIPFGVAGSLCLAALLNRHLVASSFYRTFFFLPHLTPIVATAVLWQWIFQPEVGLMNFLLSRVGIKGPAWLGSIEWAMPGLIIMNLWNSMGGNRMMIFLAGLQGIPQELYEAAEIDGADAWQRFCHVTFPMLSPTVFLNLVLGVIGALKVFTSAFVATRGGPAYATWFYALHIYTNAFQFFEMGYASALAWVFFVVMFALTYFQFQASRRWVYYAGEG